MCYTIPANKANRLYWLGRYTERVYISLHLLRRYYDRMIDGQPKDYEEFHQRLDFGNPYPDAESLRLGYMYDGNNPASLLAELVAANDNAIVLREEIKSETLSYVQLSLCLIQKAAERKETNITNLQPITDYLLAFWGSIDERVFDDCIRRLLKMGKLVENIDMHIRFDYPFPRIKEAYEELKKQLENEENMYDPSLVEQLDVSLNEEAYNQRDLAYKGRLLRFSAPVSRHGFRLRCVPCANSSQRLHKQSLFLHPSDGVTHDTDTWGNPIQYGHRMEPHDSFVFVSLGEAELSPYRLPDEDPSPLFRLPSKLTAATSSMAQIAQAFPRQSALDQASALSAWVYQHMRYQPGLTHAATTAQEALALGQGVCQDYAHILLALCRAAHIPARYVNGFMEGEGATHAWVEVYDEGTWWGIDPTHNRPIEWGYIKLSHGRDAEDCPVNRGVFTGAATQTAEIRVIVEEL